MTLLYSLLLLATITLLTAALLRVSIVDTKVVAIWKRQQQLFYVAENILRDVIQHASNASCLLTERALLLQAQSTIWRNPNVCQGRVDSYHYLYFLQLLQCDPCAIAGLQQQAGACYLQLNLRVAQQHDFLVVVLQSTLALPMPLSPKSVCKSNYYRLTSLPQSWQQLY